MKMRHVTVLACGLACALLALAPRASASDGVILINQATAARNGGAVGTCAAQAGFLITICDSGSYELSGNLTASNNGIDISANDVTLNLNGFTLSGSASGNVGVQVGTNASVANYVTIQGGMILGFDTGIDLPQVLAPPPPSEHCRGTCPPQPVKQFGLTVQHVTITFATYGIDAPRAESALVGDSSLMLTFGNVAPSDLAGVQVSSGEVVRCTIGSYDGLAITGQVLASQDVMSSLASNAFGLAVTSAGDNGCDDGKC